MGVDGVQSRLERATKIDRISLFAHLRCVQRHIPRHYRHGPLCCVVMNMRCITNLPHKDGDIMGDVCHRLPRIRLQPLRQIFWVMLQHNSKHARIIVLPIFDVLRPFVVVPCAHAELHAITQGLDFVLRLLNGLIFIIVESFWDDQFCWFIVHRLSESLKCHRSFDSIALGLGSKVFYQFLFYQFKLGSTLRAANFEDLVFQFNCWCWLICRTRIRCWISRCWPSSTAMLI